MDPSTNETNNDAGKKSRRGAQSESSQPDAVNDSAAADRGAVGKTNTPCAPVGTLEQDLKLKQKSPASDSKPGAVSVTAGKVSRERQSIVAQQGTTDHASKVSQLDTGIATGQGIALQQNRGQDSSTDTLDQNLKVKQKAPTLDSRPGAVSIIADRVPPVKQGIVAKQGTIDATRVSQLDTGMATKQGISVQQEKGQDSSTEDSTQSSSVYIPTVEVAPLNDRVYVPTVEVAPLNDTVNSHDPSGQELDRKQRGLRGPIRPGAFPSAAASTSVSFNPRSELSEVDTEDVQSGQSRRDQDTEVLESLIRTKDFAVGGGDHSEVTERGLGGGLERPDVEYGATGGPEQSGIAVATAIEEDGYVPSAVVYEPDAPIGTCHTSRFRLCTALALVVVICISVSTAVGFIFLKDEAPPTIAYRETLGIRENVQQLVGGDVLEQNQSPYSKALQWITHEDVREIEPDNPQFLQRFLAAYFYYATSQKRDWDGGCSKAKEGEKDGCMFKSVTSGSFDSPRFVSTSWKRWLGESDECDWAGVSCDDRGQLTSLELRGLNMTGTFPDGIVGFPFLQTLEIPYGELAGPLPEVIADMKHLIKLGIGGNLFTGPVPNSWYEARSLQYIDLRHNLINGTLSSSVGKLKDARSVILSYNRLSGQTPNEIGDLNSMEYVYLDNNDLNGSIPSTIGSLHGTAAFWLHHNDITGTIPTEIGNMARLDDLFVHGNQLTGRIPEELYASTNVNRMDFSGNALTGTISPRIGAFVGLKMLRLHDNGMTGTLPTEMGQLTRLDEFTAYRNAFTGAVPDELCQLRAQRLQDVKTDCAATTNGVAEIECSCCSVCCNPEGVFCNDV